MLAKRGRLVDELMEPMLELWAAATPTDDRSIVYHQLALSYLATRPDGEQCCLSLLDVVPEDSRDGLLLACYRLNSSAIRAKLEQKVREWEAGVWCPGGTGEGYLVEAILGKNARTT